MPATVPTLHLPDYRLFTDSLAILALPISSSEIHGVMCGYLCAGAVKEGETYLRALITRQNKNDSAVRTANLALFGVYAVSHQQIANFDFEFQLMLPDDDIPLAQRAQAFSEWCEGFTQGITLGGVEYEQLQEEEAQEALKHLTEFGQLDYQSLHYDEEDERALIEVSEYARLAVLRIYGDLQEENPGDQSQVAH